MLYENNIGFQPEEIEDGYYYASLRGKPTKKKIIEVCQGRVYDNREFFSQLADYDLLGPVPSLEELESLTCACDCGAAA